MLPRVVGTVLAIVAMRAAEAGVILLNADGFVSAVDPTAGGQTGQRESLAIPSGYELVAQRGTALARNTANYRVEFGQTVFSHDLYLQRAGYQANFSANAIASLTQFNFMVEADTAYDLSGWLAVNDAGNTTGRSALKASLLNVTTNTHAFYADQTSSSTIDESFVLGQRDGDSFGSLSGALSGALTAGHLYRWEFFAFTTVHGDVDQGATASGNLTLRIGTQTIPEPPPAPENSVPVPGTLPLVASALVALRWNLRRHRRAA